MSVAIGAALARWKPRDLVDSPKSFRRQRAVQVRAVEARLAMAVQHVHLHVKVQHNACD